MEIKVKNTIPQKIMAACFGSIGVFFCFLILIIVLFFSGKFDVYTMRQGLYIFGSLLCLIWFFYLIVQFIFYRTIFITSEKVVLKKWKKIVWEIKKEDVYKCEYSKIFVRKKFYPDAGDFFFILKSTKTYSERKIVGGLFGKQNYIGISFGVVKKIINLGWVVEITNEDNDGSNNVLL